MTHIPFKVSLLRLVFLLLPVTVAAQEARLSDYVDPIARLHCPSQ